MVERKEGRKLKSLGSTVSAYELPTHKYKKLKLRQTKKLCHHHQKRVGPRHSQQNDAQYTMQIYLLQDQLMVIVQ